MLRKAAEASSNKEPPPGETWEAFKGVNFNLRPNNDWTGQKIPPALQRVEEDSNLPEKLKQILVWSLSPNAPLPPGKGQRNVRLPDGCTVQNSAQAEDGSGPHQTNTESARRSVAPEHFDNDDTSESRSAQSERRSEKSRLRSRYLGGSVLGSTISLISTLKSKSDKESSQPSNNAKKTPARRTSQVECTSCFEEISEKESSKLPCNHSYCKLCLTTLITTALQNESNFPPKCCLTEIPLHTVLLSLDAKHREIYKEKAAEYAIAPQERWYCPNTKCLKWIPPAKLQRIRILNMKCPHCATKICSICRGLAHRDSADCPQDYGLEATIMLAELQGWRRCFKCRTMVERTQGCRHMTCKCGAQFCYVCGVKWRTCSCTEVDETNRQAELRRRRGARAEIAEAEAAEINRIIAQVEEMERLEAEERRREQQRQEEQRREEAELARLEEQRLREEEARRTEEERMAQELRQILRISIEESCHTIQSAWNGLLRAQKKNLDDRHLRTEQQHMQFRDEAMTRQEQENVENLAKMESNVAKRTTTIKERHNMELEAFTIEQQELEDDFFLETQLHLRGKQDKEARERRLQERFQRQREEKQQAMLSKHRSQSEALQANATMELQGLKLTNESKLARLEHRFHLDFETLLVNVAADRAWFGFLSERRQNMVDANRRLMLEALDAGQEPVGLTEDTATTIGPFLTTTQLESESSGSTPSLDGALLQEQRQEPWREVLSPSPANSASPARSLVELAATSQQLLNSLNGSVTTPESDVKKLHGGAFSHLTSNSAFAWMTGVVEDNATSSNHTTQHSPPVRSHELHRQDRPDAAPMRLPATANPAEMKMSGALPSRGHSASSRDHLEVPVPIPAPLQAGRRRPQPPSEGLKGPERYMNDPPPPVPRVPVIYLAQQSGAGGEVGDDSYTVQQPRVLGGLTPAVLVLEFQLALDSLYGDNIKVNFRYAHRKLSKQRRQRLSAQSDHGDDQCSHRGRPTFDDLTLASVADIPHRRGNEAEARIRVRARGSATDAADAISVVDSGLRPTPFMEGELD
ncbi:IBR domain-containing protein [Cladophialophora immunda]|nr:IBR domain-containing protein [Cladophialophora immunda]